MRILVGLYCAAIGLLLVARWIYDIAWDRLERPDQARPQVSLHPIAELVCAVLLALGGVLVAIGATTSVALVGLGMLLYTAIATPRYFIARNERGPAVLFAVLLALTISAIGGVLII